MTPAVVSDIPGRMRVRLAPEQCAPDFMAALQERLSVQDGVGTVDSRPSSGSVVIRYDPQRQTRDQVIARLRDAGVTVEDRPRGGGDESPRPATSMAATRLVDAMAEANEALSRATGRSLDLRLLFPLALGGWGLLRLARTGPQLNEIPAYVLLWYAFDAFWKLNYASQPPAAAPQIRHDDLP